MDRSTVARITSTELYAQNGLIGTTPRWTLDQQSYSLSATVPTEAGPFVAVSFDPSTGFRHANLFFDDDETPYPLIGGEVMRCRFSRLRVTPFLSTSWDRGTVSGTIFASPLAPLNNQVLALRLWREAPVQTHVHLPDVAQFVQNVLTTQPLALGFGAAYLYHVHAPGARSITFFAGNHNTGNPALGWTVNVYAARPELPKDDPLQTNFTTKTYAPPALATLTVPQAADTGAPNWAKVIDPGFSEYYFSTTGVTTTTPATYVLEVGCLVHYNSP